MTVWTDPRTPADYSTDSVRFILMPVNPDTATICKWLDWVALAEQDGQEAETRP